MANYSPSKYGYLKKGGLLMKAGLKGSSPQAGLQPAGMPGSAKPNANPNAPNTAGPPAPGTLNDSIYASQQNTANLNYQNTLAGLNQQQYQTKSSYGFDPEFASNPYTLANLMHQNYNRAYAGTTTGYARRGHLYSGALDRARAYDAGNYGQAQNTLQTDYSTALANIEAQKAGAATTQAGALSGAYEDMVKRALEAEPDTSLYPQDTASQNKQAKSKKKKKGKK